MARTRTSLSADVKRDAIVATAARLFTEVGFEETSMAALARAAGVAPNTVYWYFDGKDALLVAVLEHLVAAPPQGADRPASPSLADRLVELSEVFDRLERLLAAVHARAEVSPAVQAWHDAFHEQSDRWIARRARRHLEGRGATAIDERALEAIPPIWTYAIEGMVAHRLPVERRRLICQTLVRQLDTLAVAPVSPVS